MKKKNSNFYYSVFYTLVALGLLVAAFFYDYPTSLYFVISAIVVGLCAYYWIYRAWKKKSL